MKFKKASESAAKRRELLDRQGEINDTLQVLDETLDKRELKDEEKAQRNQLRRDYERTQREIDLCTREYMALHQAEQAECEARNAARPVSAGQRLREMLKGVRDGKVSREITLAKTGDNTGGSIEESGAINLTVNELIPTLNEGLGLPKGLSIVTGVTGNEIWPVSLDDADLSEVGETAELTEQGLHFDNIQPTPARCGLAITVSNQAIDNAAFDLMGFVQGKFTLALRKYLAMKLYSQAAFSGKVKGPFSGHAADGTITLDDTAYKSLLKAVAKLTDLGYNADQVCLVMDKTTEADLKATPKAAGQGGFIIENGKCAGYDYVTSHYINTTLDSDGTSVKATEDRFIGIGLFAYEAVQQHGDVRMTVDSTSQGVSLKNVTSIVLNTSWSMTDLSVKTTANGKKNTSTTAFALYKVAEPAESAESAKSTGE